MKLAVLVVIAALLTACTSSDVMMTGDARPAIQADAVRVYLRPPEKFESIALITATSNTTPSRTGNKTRVMNELKEKAASMGANGILMTVTDGGESARPVFMAPAGGVAIGAVGSGKGPMVEMQAEAIYVTTQ